jgi:hypothetical protein
MIPKDGWGYKCFKDQRNKVIIVDWVKKELSPKAWQYLKRSLENLAKRPISEWHKPNPSSKISTSNHIYVIRFKDENRTQWRIYGFHNHEKSMFSL